MKKQISKKSSKKIVNHSYFKATIKSGDVDKKSKDSENEDVKKREEELLEDAKKESRAKAAEFNNSEMIKKMILENIAKYVAIIFILIIATIGIIEFGSAFLAFLNGFLHGLIMSALGK
jgi:hypothetical protein